MSPLSPPWTIREPLSLHMVQMPGVLFFSFFVSGVVARCHDVVGSSTRRTRRRISLNSTYESTSLCVLVSCRVASHSRVMV